MRNMLYFRRISLRYRFTTPFQQILNDLLSNNTFQDHWISPMRGDDSDANYEYYAYTHPDLGLFMKYISTISSFTTNYGELYLVNYVPVDGQTTEIFKQYLEAIKKKSPMNSWEKFGTWPKSF